MTEAFGPRLFRFAAAILVIFCSSAFAEPQAQPDVDCMQGLPQNAPMQDMPLMRFDFGVRKFKPRSKCSTDIEMPGTDGANIKMYCQVCGKNEYAAETSIGSHKVTNVRNTEIGDVIFDLEDRDNNQLAMRCRPSELRIERHETYAAVLGTIGGSLHLVKMTEVFAQLDSARKFVDRLAAANIRCSRQVEGSQPAAPVSRTIDRTIH